MQLVHKLYIRKLDQLVEFFICIVDALHTSIICVTNNGDMQLVTHAMCHYLDDYNYTDNLFQLCFKKRHHSVKSLLTFFIIKKQMWNAMWQIIPMGF